MKMGAIQGSTGALLGGIVGGIDAASDGRNFWTGAKINSSLNYGQINIPNYGPGDPGMSYGGPDEPPITYGPYGLNEVKVFGGKSMSFFDGLLLAWNLKIIGPSIPDLISIDVNLGSTFGAGASNTYSMNFITRGDPSISFTTTTQNRFGGEIDWGVNVNFGYYQGNPLLLSKAALEGTVKSISAGYIYNVQGYYGYDLEDILKWKGFGTGIGLSGGGSYGSGSTYLIWP